MWLTRWATFRYRTTRFLSGRQDPLVPPKGQSWRGSRHPKTETKLTPSWGLSSEKATTTRGSPSKSSTRLSWKARAISPTYPPSHAFWNCGTVPLWRDLTSPWSKWCSALWSPALELKMSPVKWCWRSFPAILRREHFVKKVKGRDFAVYAEESRKAGMHAVHYQ